MFVCHGVLDSQKKLLEDALWWECWGEGDGVISRIVPDSDNSWVGWINGDDDDLIGDVSKFSEIWRRNWRANESKFGDFGDAGGLKASCGWFTVHTMESGRFIV